MLSSAITSWPFLELLVIVCLLRYRRHGRSIAASSTAPVDVDVAAVISTTITDYQQYSGVLKRSTGSTYAVVAGHSRVALRGRRL